MAFIDDVTKTDEEITKELLDDMPEKYQKTVGFYTWDIFRSISKSLKKIWDKLAYLANLNDLYNMQLEDLINYVFQRRGIKYKYATASSGELLVVLGSGTIPKGSIFSTKDGLNFIATETTFVEKGGYINVQCTQTGTIGNVPANTINIIPTTIPGIVEVTNPLAFTNGYDAETKEELLERYFEDIQMPVTSGNIYHYKKWAKEVEGVKNADVKPLWNGDNTVKVIIINQNSEPADDELVAKVQEYIDPNSLGRGEGQAPIGAYCTVESASSLEIRVFAEVILKSAESLDKVKERVKANIKNYLSTIAFSKEINYVSYAQINSQILNAVGVADLRIMTINENTDNIIVPNDDVSRSVAVLGSLDLVQVEV